MVRVPFDTATAVGQNIPHAPKCRAGTISNIGFITDRAAGGFSSAASLSDKPVITKEKL